MSNDGIAALLEYSSKHGFVKNSIDVIEECFRTYGSKPTDFAISYNGGKDCTVVLHLVYCVYMQKYDLNERRNIRLNVQYVKMPDSFDELEDFVYSTVKFYNLNLLEYSGPSYKTALENMKMNEMGSKIKAIFMGIRTSDLETGAAIKAFQYTDEGWPKYMRVNPILDWSYHDIWAYLRDLKVPYCPLYDHGFTSIGSKSNSHANLKLKRKNSQGEDIYLPAYMLDDASQERNCRE